MVYQTVSFNALSKTHPVYVTLFFRRARELLDVLPPPLDCPFIVGEWPFGLPLVSAPITTREEAQEEVLLRSSCQLAETELELISTTASVEIVAAVSPQTMELFNLQIDSTLKGEEVEVLT